MNRSQLRSILYVSVITCGMVASANAALVSRLDGRAFYDTALDITWLADANAGAGSSFDDGSNTVDGRMRWLSANDWAASLEVSGVNGWRLADMNVSGGGVVVDCSTASAIACLDNEYGYHFYHNGVDSLNPHPFGNVQTTNYWSRNESASNAWLFDFTFNDGSQLTTSKNYNASAWAVHDGDVGVVPLPAVAWLFGSALFGLTLMCRR